MMIRNKRLLAVLFGLLAVAFGVLACRVTIGDSSSSGAADTGDTITPAVSTASSPTPEILAVTPDTGGSPAEAWPVINLIGSVKVHTCADTGCAVSGWLLAGAPVRARCTGDWCELASGGYFWAGCAEPATGSYNAKGCESK